MYLCCARFACLWLVVSSVCVSVCLCFVSIVLLFVFCLVFCLNASSLFRCVYLSLCLFVAVCACDLLLLVVFRFICLLLFRVWCYMIVFVVVSCLIDVFCLC